MDRVHVTLNGANVLDGVIKILICLLFVLGVEPFDQFLECLLKFESTLVLLSLVDLDLFHKATEPLRYLIHIVQPEYLIHLLECDLLPLFIDIIDSAVSFEYFGED